MMQGIVDGLVARMAVKIRGSDNRFHTIDAIVDTGFDGWLAMPPNSLETLGASWASEGRGILADGSHSRFDIYAVRIMWHGRSRTIPLYELGTEILIGMALLTGSEINLKVRPGGKVTIKPMRSRR